MAPWDVVIVGGGILGTSLAHWIGARYDARVAVLERENRLAAHASGRNTGVIHRPFYLDPETAGLFARVAQASFPIWKKYALERRLPWSEIGTLKVAMALEEVRALEKNIAFARANGMRDDELELLDKDGVRALARDHEEGAAAVRAPVTDRRTTRVAPSPSRTIIRARSSSSDRSAARNAARSFPASGGKPQAPLAKRAAVSLVLVSPSTTMRLNVASAASRSRSRASAGARAASVNA